jgi:hypothetical protein
VLSLALALTLSATSNPWLEKARTAYSRLDCNAVLSDLGHAKQVPTDDLETRLAIFDLEGRCHVALGHLADAEAAFTQMISLDPRAELDPSLSPKIRDAFKSAKRKLYPEDYLALKELPAGPDLKRAELVDPWRRVSSVVVGRWDEEQQKFVEETLPPNGNVYLAQVKERAWYLEARNASATSIARLGSRDVPAPLPRPVAVAQPVPTFVEQPADKPDASLAKKRRNTAGGVQLATGAALLAGGVVMFVVAGTNRSAAEKAEWANDAYKYESTSTTTTVVGHAVFWPGVVLAGVGFGLSF